jgi:hypothetical protein
MRLNASMPVWSNAPKILAHLPFLVDFASDPQRPPDDNDGDQADNARDFDWHDVAIIAPSG